MYDIAKIHASILTHVGRIFSNSYEEYTHIRDILLNPDQYNAFPLIVIWKTFLDNKETNDANDNLAREAFQSIIQKNNEKKIILETPN
jgi:hypothetical protein